MSDKENQVARSRRSKVAEDGVSPNDIALGSEESGSESNPVSEIRGNIVDPSVVQPEEPARMEAQITCSIEAAARLYAEGYRAETHLAGLVAFCQSTGLPSFGTVDQMQETLKAFGYSIRGLR